MVLNIKKSKEEIDSKVEEQVREIRKKNFEIRKQQKKTLEILKDVKLQKEKADMLAHDLEKFQLAVSEASDHIVITDAEGNIIFMNKAAEGITGFSVAESIGKKAGSKELWGGKMDDEFYKKLWKTIKKDKHNFSGEISNIRKNGERYQVFANISPVVDEAGEVQFFVVIERDITKEKEIDRMKSEFVSVASHQLRTPLTGIKCFLELLLEDKKISKQQRDYLDEIQGSNERMIGLVNDLLNVSRIETGKNFKVEKKKTDLSLILKEVIGEQGMDAKDRGVEIVCQDECTTQIMLNADGIKIKQVL